WVWLLDSVKPGSHSGGRAAAGRPDADCPLPPRLLMIEATIPVGSADELVMLLGASDQHLRRIRDSVPAKISARDGKIHVSGDEQAVLQATEIIEQIKNSVGREGAVSAEQVTHIIKQVTDGPPASARRRQASGEDDSPADGWAGSVRRSDSYQRFGFLQRPGRNWQNL